MDENGGSYGRALGKRRSLWWWLCLTGTMVVPGHAFGVHRDESGESWRAGVLCCLCFFLNCGNRGEI